MKAQLVMYQDQNGEDVRVVCRDPKALDRAKQAARKINSSFTVTPYKNGNNKGHGSSRDKNCRRRTLCLKR